MSHYKDDPEYNMYPKIRTFRSSGNPNSDYSAGKTTDHFADTEMYDETKNYVSRNDPKKIHFQPSDDDNQSEDDLTNKISCDNYTCRTRIDDDEYRTKPCSELIRNMEFVLKLVALTLLIGAVLMPTYYSISLYTNENTPEETLKIKHWFYPAACNAIAILIVLIVLIVFDVERKFLESLFLLMYIIILLGSTGVMLYYLIKKPPYAARGPPPPTTEVIEDWETRDFPANESDNWDLRRPKKIKNIVHHGRKRKKHLYHNHIRYKRNFDESNDEFDQSNHSLPEYEPKVDRIITKVLRFKRDFDKIYGDNEFDQSNHSLSNYEPNRKVDKIITKVYRKKINANEDVKRVVFDGDTSFITYVIPCMLLLAALIMTIDFVLLIFKDID